ncbi:MAG: hypothetical protein ACYCOU_04320 [Sulfobacillus sp.]
MDEQKKAMSDALHAKMQVAMRRLQGLEREESLDEAEQLLLSLFRDSDVLDAFPAKAQDSLRRSQELEREENLDEAEQVLLSLFHDGDIGWEDPTTLLIHHNCIRLFRKNCRRWLENPRKPMKVERGTTLPPPPDNQEVACCYVLRLDGGKMDEPTAIATAEFLRKQAGTSNVTDVTPIGTLVGVEPRRFAAVAAAIESEFPGLTLNWGGPVVLL